MNRLQCKSIVVGVDFSGYSKVVVAQARILAKALKASLTLVFCDDDLALHELALPRHRRELLNVYESQIRSFYRVTDRERVKVEFGRPEQRVVSVAKSLPHPLIFVGYQSGHQVAHFFLGSVAEKVVANAGVPVWIQRGKRVALPKKFLVPCDLSKRTEQTILEARRLAKSLGGRVEMYHILLEAVPVLDYPAWVQLSNAMRTADDRRVEVFRKRYPELKAVRAQGSVADRIRELAKKADLIVMNARVSAKPKLVFGGTSSKVVRGGDKPILLIP